MAASLSDVITSRGIPRAAGIPWSSCRVTRQYLADRLAFGPRSAYIGIIPYLTEEYFGASRRTVSAYAAGYDYHLFIEETGRLIIEDAEKIFPGAHFAVFGDKSPIDERRAAAAAGLGVIGKNGLLITPEYSSYVFLFEIISDIEPDTVPREPGKCPGCGACIAACPSMKEGRECLSSLTQKKCELTPEEEDFIRRNGSVWGCDVCQEACPLTKRAVDSGSAFTKIDYFRKNVRPAPRIEDISDPDDFAQRAYSWRGPSVILRNMRIVGEADDKEEKA